LKHLPNQGCHCYSTGFQEIQIIKSQAPNKFQLPIFKYLKGHFGN